MLSQECPKIGYIETQNAKVSRELKGFDDSLESADYLSTRVEWSRTVADIEQCEVCGSMVVDLATGKFYCGLAVPPEVVTSNKRILQS
jgi:hypothetical protein